MEMVNSMGNQDMHCVAKGNGDHKTTKLGKVNDQLHGNSVYFDRKRKCKCNMEIKTEEKNTDNDYFC